MRDDGADAVTDVTGKSDCTTDDSSIRFGDDFIEDFCSIRSCLVGDERSAIDSDLSRTC